MPVPTKYTYAISTDTLNALVASGRLTEEIQNSTIVTAIDLLSGGISTNADILNIWFKDVLTTPDQTTLTSVVNAHTGTPLLKNIVSNINIKSMDTSVQLPTLDATFADRTGYNVYYPGFRHIVLKNQVNIFDISHTVDYKLQGLGFRVNENVVDGDKLTVQLVDVDGIIYPAGTVLITFAQDLYLWANRDFQSKETDVKTLYSWMYIRFIYTSVGTVNNVTLLTEHYLRTLPV